ncbi:hypothetical protein D3C80_2200960 [compost metagenome]
MLAALVHQFVLYRPYQRALFNQRAHQVVPPQGNPLALDRQLHQRAIVVGVQ